MPLAPGCRRHTVWSSEAIAPRSKQWWKSRAGASPLQQVDWLVHVFDPEVACKARVALCDGEIHLPGDSAIAEVAGDAGAQLGDVEGFGEVHLEHGADARAEREEVGGCLSGIGATSKMRGFF